MRKTLRFSLMLTALILPLLSCAQKPPGASAGRFIDNGDGTVTDTRLRLMWQKSDNGNEVTFEQAQQYCRNLSLGGHKDWRLPKPDERDTAVVVELMMPLHSRAAYARLDLYWSSDPTVLIPFNYRPSSGAEISRAYPARKDDAAFVRAVRSLTVSPPRDGA
ncbi:MAG TPA: DUF1566 domain-containing protein [Deltaproteobacteria bacterium]|nr:DUF1566 domain-containing protein [Deltaproteobacteria bacterium]